ncbi:MAG: IS30 family transposase, partial [Prevotella sp.]|nr:IS30 family transposase [Prevotella sp.]
NFILMEKLPQGRKALPLAKAVVRLLYPYRDHVRTITTDNGSEFAAHRYITEKLNRRPREKLNFNTPKCEFYKNFE